MFRMTLITLAAIATAPAVLAEGALSASKRIEVPAQPEAVWEKIGDFCAIETWLDVISACEEVEEGGKTFRLLTVPDGVIKEELTEQDGMSYSYTIVDGPLPVADYKAKLAVTADDDGGSGIKWSGTFNANGLSDEETIELFEGVYSGGLAGIEAQLN